MLCLLRQLRDWIDDLRLQCMDRRYQKQLRVIDSLTVPDELKRAAKEQALNRIGAQLEHYVNRP